MSNTATSLSSGICSAPSSSTYTLQTAQYDGSNRFTSLNGVATPSDYYDQSGNVHHTSDQTYLYDEEGRLCAVLSPSPTGGGAVVGTQYIYDAEGRRVAKGNISQASCDRMKNGFSATDASTRTYVLDQSGNQVSELDGQQNWQHTNVFAAGRMLATYDQAGLHFNVTDALGTKRVQVSATGQPELNCLSMPSGNGEPCLQVGNIAETSEQRFTGKERDYESGLDYFSARYYSSNMGRFSSPDPSGLQYADMMNPQSLNLYAYALNNPLKNTDPTGLYCYYGDPNSTSDGFDNTQYDFHSSSGECMQADKNGNKDQWIDDAYTHDGADDDNRPGEAVSSNTQTSQPSGFPMNQPVGYQLLSSLPRCSLQFNQQVQVGGLAPTPPAPKSTDLPPSAVGTCALGPTTVDETRNAMRVVLGYRNQSSPQGNTDDGGSSDIFMPNSNKGSKKGGYKSGQAPMGSANGDNAVNGGAAVVQYISSMGSCINN